MTGSTFVLPTTESATVVDPAALARASRELVVRRLPYFALGWLGLGTVLRVGLVLRGGLSVRLAVVSIAVQAAILAVAVTWCRRVPAAAGVRAITFGACTLLVVLTTGFFSLLGGSVEVFVFALLVIAIGSSVAFAWGWQLALGLCALGGGIGASALVVGVAPLTRFSDPIEIALEALIGAAIAVWVAEASARSFARGFREAQARHDAAARLAAAYDAYRDLAENAPDLIFTHDLDGRITYVNAAFASAAGVPAHELIGCDGGALVPRDANPDPALLRARMAAGEVVPPQLYWVKGPEGRLWMECVASPIRDGAGRMVGVRGIVRDVTARREAEEALRASLEDLRRSEERLRRLARRQASIREEERKRLGFDLHDDVCQELVGIAILVESLRSRVGDAAPELAPELGRIARYVGEVGEHLRQLARDLRPMILRELGLRESLHSLAEAMTAAGTVVTSDLPNAVPRLDEESEIGVYRIAQEALTNALRHAGARRICIGLTVAADTVALEVRDDGCGFTPEARRGEALGLVGMEERALALGGRLELRSAPGEGTTVRLTCPLVLRAASAA